MSQQPGFTKSDSFPELANFLSSYFGDYWPGKSDADMLMEAVLEGSRDYLLDIHDQICKFLATDISDEKKRDFILASTMYRGSTEETLRWLQMIDSLLLEKISYGEA
jgi:hypothetical protein